VKRPFWANLIVLETKMLSANVELRGSVERPAIAKRSRKQC